MVMAIISSVITYCAINKNITPPESTLRERYEKLTALNLRHTGQNTGVHQVKDFAPTDYEFGAENFGKGGNCKGIVFSVREKYQKHDTDKIELTANDKFILYGSKQEPKEEAEKEKDPAFQIDQFYANQGTHKNFTWEELTVKRYDGVPEDRFDNKIIGQIYDLQQTSDYEHNTIFNLSPEKAKPWSLFELICNYPNMKKKIDLDYITSRLDENRLVALAVTNDKFTGHALLCYKAVGYENNIWRLYVLDPNIVYSRYRDKNPLPEEQTYITIGYIDGKQYYSYNPCLNDNYVYRNQYNSFVPGAIFYWD